MIGDGDMDARLSAEGDRLAERAVAIAATDDAFAQFETAPGAVLASRSRRSSRVWLGTAAAALVVVLAVGVGLLVRSGADGDRRASTASPSVAVVVDGRAPSATSTDDSPTLPSAPVTDVTSPPSPSPAPSVPSVPSGTGERGTPLRSCTYTDPAARPITVGRALSCADGTEVWVTGVVVETSDGTAYLCDELAADESRSCAGATLRLVGDREAGTGVAVGPGGGLVGVKRGDDLVLRSPAVSTPSATPPGPLSSLPPTSG